MELSFIWIIAIAWNVICLSIILAACDEKKVNLIWVGIIGLFIGWPLAGIYAILQTLKNTQK